MLQRPICFLASLLTLACSAVPSVDAEDGTSAARFDDQVPELPNADNLRSSLKIYRDSRGRYEWQIASVLGELYTLMPHVPATVEWNTGELADGLVEEAKNVEIQVDDGAPVSVHTSAIETERKGYVVKRATVSIPDRRSIAMKLIVNGKVVTTASGIPVAQWTPAYLRFSVAGGYLHLSKQELSNKQTIKVPRPGVTNDQSNFFVVLENDVPHSNPKPDKTADGLYAVHQIEDGQVAHSSLSRTFVGLDRSVTSLHVTIPRHQKDTWFPWEVTLNFVNEPSVRSGAR
jgi:hypothetical protein